MNHTVRRIDFLRGLNGASRYLEVGVFKGDTFLNLEMDEMVAVDPVIRFDTTQSFRNKREFFAMPSDEFFDSAASDRHFDIIFLDGLHTYDQTLRDLMNALLCAHPRSFILIDDTVPNDLYSAMRNPSLAIQLRRNSYFGPPEKMNGCWHGDTYKVLFYIKLFLSKMEYATITTDGNPQTLLWSKSMFASSGENKLPFKPFKDMRALRYIVESMRQVDYYWTLNEFRDIFQECSEAALMSYLSDNLDG